MTLEHTELTNLVSGEDMAHLRAAEETIVAAMATIQEQHPRYSWRATDEIGCSGCGESLDIPALASTTANADRAFSAHQARQLSPLLAGLDTDRGPLGN